ncbi:DUF1206 domain-containing protein [Microlunatus elymi]|uniref:DUF1206 domain-containing protein n=1 Tax=Microlunatus elymi TaxID=2596828 RepID=A0A516Q2Y4_9ACTN|nr:DUF1206 domain-containing protein [Microlunatus elymi]QDP97571.1 DUF1206 domain-containing protein [Microlunatus elymi]
MGSEVEDTAKDAADDARDTAEALNQRIRRTRGYRWLVALGLCAYGVVHLLVAGIALQVAWSGGGQPSEQGALRAIASTPVGPVVLIVLGVGLLALVPWQGFEALLGHGRVAQQHDPKRRTVKRFASAGRAIVYLALGISAFRFVGGSGSSGGSQHEETMTGQLMAHPFGRYLVAAIGLAILAVGVNQVIKGARMTFTEDLRGSTAAPAIGLGVVGYIAKGISLVLVGGLFGWAALTYDPKRAGGLDEALRLVRDQPAGPVLLTVLAAGLACFGFYCFVWAKNAET